MWFHHKGKTYSRGQTVDIDPKYFDASRMLKVEEPKPVETPKEETVTVEPVILVAEKGHGLEESPSEEEKPVVEPACSGEPCHAN